MRFLRLLFALWLAITPAFAWAGSLTLLGAGKPAAGGSATPTIVPGTAVAWKNGYTGGRAITGLNGGLSYPAGSTVVVFAVSSDSLAFTSPQIGGVALTALASATNLNATVSVQTFWANLPAGATDTFTFANQTCCDKFAIYAVYFTNVNSATLTGAYQSAPGSQADPQLANTPASLTIPTSGFGVIFQGTINPSAPFTIAYQTTTPSFLVSATSEAGGSTSCVSPGGVNCSVVTAQMQVTSQHSITAGSGWVGRYTGGAFTDATAAIVIGP